MQRIRSHARDTQPIRGLGLSVDMACKELQALVPPGSRKKVWDKKSPLWVYVSPSISELTTNDEPLLRIKWEIYFKKKCFVCSLITVQHVDEYKFLGFVFNKKLTFIPHIKYLKTKPCELYHFCEWLPSQNGELTDKPLLNYAYHWSSHSWTMPFLSTDLPGGPTSKSSTLYTTKVLGVFRTSPVNSLYTEAHKVLLQLRCEKLAFQYFTKLKFCSSNSAYDCILNPKYKLYFEK